MEDNLLENDRKRYADDITLQELVRLRVENERLREALRKIVEVTDYGTKTSTTMSQFAINNANILARSALQKKESE